MDGLSLLNRELEIAGKIQLSFLQSKFPAFPDGDDIDLYGNHTARIAFWIV